MSKLYVIAGTRQEFIDWIKSNDDIIQEYPNRQDVVYVDHYSIFKGVSDPDGIFIGTWLHRADIADIVVNLYFAMRDIRKRMIIKSIMDDYVDK